MLVLAGFVTFVVGCHESGTWQDDPKNWNRIFGSPKPKDVTVVRSWYLRTPHWSYEVEYLIQIAANAKLKKAWLALGELKRLDSPDEIAEAHRFTERRPKWFAPKDRAEYEVWVRSNEPHSKFRVFVDRETGDLFATDYSM